MNSGTTPSNPAPAFSLRRPAMRTPEPPRPRRKEPQCQPLNGIPRKEQPHQPTVEGLGRVDVTCVRCGLLLEGWSRMAFVKQQLPSPLSLTKLQENEKKHGCCKRTVCASTARHPDRRPD